MWTRPCSGGAAGAGGGRTQQGQDREPHPEGRLGPSERPSPIRVGEAVRAAGQVWVTLGWPVEPQL